MTTLLARAARRAAACRRRRRDDRRSSSNGAGGRNNHRRGSRGHRASGDRRAGSRSSRSSSHRSSGRGGRSSGARARDASGDGRGAGSNRELGLGKVGARGDLGRAGDVVAGQGLVDVDQDARVRLGVERLTKGTRGGQRARTGDGQVEALGVVLGTVGVLGTVQRNDLVTPDVVAGREVRGDLDHPGVVVADQLIRAPRAGQGRVVDNTNTSDLEELQGRLVDSGAVRVALGQHVDDGTVMRRRPCRPVDLYVVAGLDRSITPSVGSILVADDVAAGISVWRNVAIVGVTCGPGSFQFRFLFFFFWTKRSGFVLTSLPQ